MNIIKRFTFAANAFINGGKLYDSYLGETLVNFLGGFSFQDADDELFLKDGYAKNSDVYSIVRKVAQTASYIEWNLYDDKKDGKELITDGELYDLLKHPNRLQTRQEYAELALTYLLLLGNTYTAGTKAVGMGDVIREFISLPAEDTEIILGSNIDPIAGYVVNSNKRVTFEADEVMHVKYPNPVGDGADKLYGLSPLQAGNMLLQTGNNQQEASASILKNKGASGILTNDSDRSFTKEQGQDIQNEWDAKQGGKSFGKILATSAKVRYLQLGMSPTDLKIIENQVITLRQLCNLYSVDSSLFNDPANKTFNNRKEATKALYSESVLPNLGLLLSNMNNWLLPEWSAKDNKNYVIEPSTDDIEALQADQKEEAEKDKVKMEGINIVLNMPISAEAKAGILVKEYDYTEDEANLITNENTTE